MSNIIPFSFDQHAVRAISIDDQSWFVAGDVSAALEYSVPSAMTRHLDDDEKGVSIVHTPGGDQEMLIINESGLYSAILRSRKPSAKRFKKWVTSEVLPAIRKTGTYTVPTTTLSPAQQRHIQNRVAELAGNSRKAFSKLYSTIKDQFGVGTYKDVPADQYPALCKLLLCDPMDGEWLAPEPPKQDGVYLTGEDLYRVYFLARHFNALHTIFKESNLYQHLTGLGSRIGIDMIDHFKDGSFASHTLLGKYATEMDAFQRERGINHYR